jgi:hypothetical protein
MEFARVDAEARNLVQAEVADALMPDLRGRFEQRLVHPHLADVARQPHLFGLKLPELLRREALAVQRSGLATLVVAPDRNLVNADAGASGDLRTAAPINA